MIWLIGNKGMLGTELSLLLEKEGLAFTGTDREVDITDPAALDAFIESCGAARTIQWIINCAAYTAVDKAEDDADLCRRLNTEGAGNIAAAAKRAGATLIHISTDYVFNGKGRRPYKENDPTDPIGVYGLTKRDGELRVLEGNPASYILRTAWLYGEHGNNFVHTMLRLMNERDSLSVVNDQRGSPTWAHDLAWTIAALIKNASGNPEALPYGIYHYTNEGETTWFGFAQKIYERGRQHGLIHNECEVKPIPSTAFPARVTRPAYSVLGKTKIRTALGLAIPQWEESLEEFLCRLAMKISLS